jgi:hypothetical protein
MLVLWGRMGGHCSSLFLATPCGLLSSPLFLSLSLSSSLVTTGCHGLRHGDKFSLQACSEGARRDKVARIEKPSQLTAHSSQRVLLFLQPGFAPRAPAPSLHPAPRPCISTSCSYKPVAAISNKQPAGIRRVLELAELERRAPPEQAIGFV